MKRRDLMLLLAGAMTAARALYAQQKAMPVIGFLSSGSHDQTGPFMAVFRQRLSEAGYVDGQNWRSKTAGRRGTMSGCPRWPPISSQVRPT